MTLVDAIPAIVTRTSARVVIGCRAKTDQGQERLTRAQVLVKARGYAGFCRFVGFFQDFPGLLAAATVCVMPATSFRAKVDYPYALLEAMGWGVPVVVGRETPAAELVEGGGGEAIPARSEKSLAEAVCSLILDPDRRNSSGESARSKVRDLCNPSRIAREYLRLWNEVSTRD